MTTHFHSPPKSMKRRRKFLFDQPLNCTGLEEEVFHPHPPFPPPFHFFNNSPPPLPSAHHFVKVSKTLLLLYRSAYAQKVAYGGGKMRHWRTSEKRRRKTAAHHFFTFIVRPPWKGGGGERIGRNFQSFSFSTTTFLLFFARPHTQFPNSFFAHKPSNFEAGEEEKEWGI